MGTTQTAPVPPAKPPAPKPPKLKAQPAILPHTLDSETERRLKRGLVRIEARLDLHGLDEKTAYARLVAFITDSRANNRKLVLVITGKGKAGGGILRRNLPLWLESPALRSSIASLQTAPRYDGGEGAVYIRLY